MLYGEFTKLNLFFVSVGRFLAAQGSSSLPEAQGCRVLMDIELAQHRPPVAPREVGFKSPPVQYPAMRVTCCVTSNSWPGVSGRRPWPLPRTSSTMT